MERSLERALSEKLAVDGRAARGARSDGSSGGCVSRTGRAAGRAAKRGWTRREVPWSRHAWRRRKFASAASRLIEQFARPAFDLAAVLEGLTPDATIAAWEQTLAETDETIERLGAINLAAIEEFEEQSERKEYLDRQFADLTEALDTLEAAIRKIDTRDRQRFQDTFDRVNAVLRRTSRGCSAAAGLSGDDRRGHPEAGVAVMARPPGKRNSTIHLLSGGEKALTAVALVFSIFELNPAPFCLLDEVDAPLDDDNVGRFCDIVRDMSQRVQFIFITHNKATMELADAAASA